MSASVRRGDGSAPPSGRHWLDRVGTWTTTRPRTVLGLTAAVAATLALFVPRLESDFSPRALVGDGGEEAARLDAWLDRVGGAREPLLVLVEPAGPLATETLDLVHRLGRALAALPDVRAVRSLTTVPLPHVPPAEPPGPALTLDALDEAAPAPDAARAEAERAAWLGELVASDPARFPRGLPDVVEGSGGLAVGPLVAGDRVEDDEAARVREVVAARPELRGTLLGRSGGLVPVVVELPSDLDAAALERALRAVRGAIEATAAPAGHRVRLAGVPFLRSELVARMGADQVRLVALSLLANVIVLVLLTRWAPGVLLPLAAVGLTLGAVVGGMGLAGQRLDLLTNVVPPLLVTLAIGDSIHLIARYREELWRPGADGSVPAALRRTVRAMGVACFVTSATTAVGFGSLVVAESAALRRFGVTAALGVMVAYVVTMLVLPASLALVRPPKRPTPARRGGSDRRFGRLAAWAARRAGLVVVGSAIVFLGSLALARGVRADRGLLDQFDADDPAHAVTREVERELDGVRSLEVVLVGEPGRFARAEGLAALAALDAAIEREPGVIAAAGPTDPLASAWATLTGDPAARADALDHPARGVALLGLVTAEAPAALDGWLSADRSTARLAVRLRDAGQAETRARIAAIERHLAPLRAAGLEVGVGGEARAASRGLALVVDDLLASLGLAVVVIFGFLAVLFRSPGLALLSVPPNVLPLAVVLAAMAVRGIPLGPATAIVFGVSLGLAVDGTIHLLTRLREEERSHVGAGAIVRAARHTGRAIALGAATLIAGFAVLLTSGFVPVRLFGELSVVAIATAVVADLVLLPALVALARRPRRHAGDPSGASRRRGERSPGQPQT